MRKGQMQAMVVLMCFWFLAVLVALPASLGAQTAAPKEDKTKVAPAPAKPEAPPAKRPAARPAPAKPAPAKPAAAKPAVPQRLVIAQGTDVLSMDSNHVTDAPSFTVLDHMVETLLELTPTGDIAPQLAERWEVSADATEYTFFLRKGVKFHDGTPFNAEAVKVNLDRRMDPKAATRFGLLVAPIASVTVVDEFTIRLKTKFP
jgi:ABC-type transport system substrate-binding protein